MLDVDPWNVCSVSLSGISQLDRHYYFPWKVLDFLLEQSEGFVEVAVENWNLSSYTYYGISHYEGPDTWIGYRHIGIYPTKEHYVYKPLWVLCNSMYKWLSSTASI